MSKDLSSLMNRKLNNLTLPAKPKRQFQNDFIAKKKEALQKRRTKENNRANFTDEVMTEQLLHCPTKAIGKSGKYISNLNWSLKILKRLII